MNVTGATPTSVGRALGAVGRKVGSAGRALGGTGLTLRECGQRIRLFARHPVEQFRMNVERTGFGYPSQVVFLIDVVVLAIALIAVGQRIGEGYLPSVLPFVAALLTLAHWPLHVLFDVMPKPLLLTALTLTAVALFLAQPVQNDAAPFILIAVAGEVAAIAPMIVSIPVALTMIAQLMFFESIGHVDLGLPIYGFAVLCGWMTGQMMNYQRRYLYQEREYQEVRALQAADEERRRIAREVHDVIAHSLSITLLHVTAARHALQTDRDVDEAVDALADAERLGRQAMADIRRTVGLLDQRPASQTPEPGLEDIPELVEDFVRAGMNVDYSLCGDTTRVSAGIGLALYRISQESLSNIAKHAPGARATVRIVLSAKEVAVEVRNTLAAGALPRTGRGMGISGMRQRAALLGGTLTSGPLADGWHVHARIPLTSGQLACMAAVAEDSLWTVLQSMTRKRADEDTGPESNRTDAEKSTAATEQLLPTTHAEGER
ncbi:sensor histidine kinase [Nocardia sp. NPDC003693]